MKKFLSKWEIIKGILNNERGASAVEYALLAGLIAIVIIGSLLALGPQISAVFDRVVNELTAVVGTGQ
jgi:pilus assembly protein Flp/PilA